MSFERIQDDFLCKIVGFDPIVWSQTKVSILGANDSFGVQLVCVEIYGREDIGMLLLCERKHVFHILIKHLMCNDVIC